MREKSPFVGRSQRSFRERALALKISISINKSSTFGWEMTMPEQKTVYWEGLFKTQHNVKSQKDRQIDE